MESLTEANVPNVIFKTRVRDEDIEGENPFRWQDVSSEEIFKDKKVVVLALPCLVRSRLLAAALICQVSSVTTKKCLDWE